MIKYYYQHPNYYCIVDKEIWRWEKIPKQWVKMLWFENLWVIHSLPKTIPPLILLLNGIPIFDKSKCLLSYEIEKELGIFKP